MKKKLIFYRRGESEPYYDAEKESIIPIDDNYFALMEMLNEINYNLKKLRTK